MGDEKDVGRHVFRQGNEALSQPAHCLDRETIVSELLVNPQDGLSAAEAKSRIQKYGKNELEGGPGVQPLKILLRQVANAMMLVKLPITLLRRMTLSC